MAQEEPHLKMFKGELHVKMIFLIYVTVRVWAAQWCGESLSGKLSFV